MDKQDCNAERTELALALKEFAAHAAHEISNPLNAIGLNAELSLTLLKLGRLAEAEDMLKRLLKDCWTCGREVRSFVRLGESLAEPAQQLSVAALLKELTELIATRSARPIEQFVCNSPADLPMVRVAAFSLNYALDYVVRRLITDDLQQMDFSATAVGTEVALHISTVPAVLKIEGRGAQLPLGLSFFKRTLAAHGVRLDCPVDGSGTLTVWLPV